MWCCMVRCRVLFVFVRGFMCLCGLFVVGCVGVVWFVFVCVRFVCVLACDRVCCLCVVCLCVCSCFNKTCLCRVFESCCVVWCGVLRVAYCVCCGCVWYG